MQEDTIIENNDNDDVQLLQPTTTQVKAKRANARKKKPTKEKEIPTVMKMMFTKGNILMLKNNLQILVLAKEIVLVR